jgi:hypothetical protein
MRNLQGMNESECVKLHEKMYKNNKPVDIADLETYWFYESFKYPEKAHEENSLYQSEEEIKEFYKYCEKFHEENVNDY